MTFPSVVFIACFAPLFLICYFSLPKKNLIFFLFSLLFFFWGETKYIGVLITFIGINYVFGLLIGYGSSIFRRKLFLAIGVAANCSLLFYYKYFFFFLSEVLPDLFGVNIPDTKNPHLPLGISYCTFHGISYLVDVYRAKVICAKSPLDIGLYISMFPHLVAGPIVRYHTIAKALVRRCITFGRISFGLRLFVIGLAQKVLIADNLGSVADRIFSFPLESLDTVTAWTGASAYTLQIFYDFCGYSFMAIGIGIITGFRLPRNFRYPYFSQSITEFWRRWHISLSTWFREYLYIPLGGNRKGKGRTVVNLFVIFFLCGLWHGAAYTFVLWGLYHGLLLIIERLGVKSLLTRLPRLFRHAYATLAIMIGWVFFRSENTDQAIAMLSGMAGLNDAVQTKTFAQLVSHEQMTAFILGILFATPVVEWMSKKIRLRFDLNKNSKGLYRAHTILHVASLTAVFMISFTYVLAGTYRPFLYFRF